MSVRPWVFPVALLISGEVVCRSPRCLSREHPLVDTRHVSVPHRGCRRTHLEILPERSAETGHVVAWLPPMFNNTTHEEEKQVLSTG